MSKYYYLGIAIPFVEIGVEPEISFSDFWYMLVQNLSAKDLKAAKAVRFLDDIYNIKAYWTGDKLDPRGNLSQQRLEEMLLSNERAPQFIVDFLQKYESQEDRLKYFSALVVGYFNYEIPRLDGFLKKYLQMEREIRLLMVGFRAKMLNRDLFRELQFENPDDDFVAQILAQKDTKDFEPPASYASLKPLFEKYYEEPLKLHKALIEYKFNKIEEMLGFEKFSIDRILGTMIQLIMAEKWIELDHEQGTQMIDRLVKESA
jgi:hypothetical protein